MLDPVLQVDIIEDSRTTVNAVMNTKSTPSLQEQSENCAKGTFHKIPKGPGALQIQVILLLFDCIHVLVFMNGCITVVASIFYCIVEDYSNRIP